MTRKCVGCIGVAVAALTLCLGVSAKAYDALLPIAASGTIAVWDRWSRPISSVIWQRAREVNPKTLPDWVRREWQAGNADGTWNMW